MSLPLEIAAKAEEIVNSLTQTDYQHKDNIDPATGVYDCDCNGYVGFVLKKTAPNHLAHIPKETNQPRPRAFEYFTFFASLTPSSAGDWKRVDLTKDANRGDIVAWRFPTLETHSDTGHVVILAEAPKLAASGDFFSVRVYDSALEAYFDDTRKPGGNPSPKGTTGVGSGISISKSTGSDGRSPISSRRRSRRNIPTTRSPSAAPFNGPVTAAFFTHQTHQRGTPHVRQRFNKGCRRHDRELHDRLGRGVKLERTYRF